MPTMPAGMLKETPFAVLSEIGSRMSYKARDGSLGLLGHNLLRAEVDKVICP